MKVEKSNVYHEDRQNLKNWFMQFKIYFSFHSVSKTRKILFVSIYFKKRIQYWIKLYFKKHFDDDENSKKMFSNFNKFKNKLQRIFNIFNEKQTAKCMIQHLIQKTSTSNYVVKFQKYVNFTKWNDVVFMTMFRREFKNNVKNELMRDKTLIINLEIIIERVICKFEDDWKLSHQLMSTLVTLVWHWTSEWNQLLRNERVNHSVLLIITQLLSLSSSVMIEHIRFTFNSSLIETKYVCQISLKSSM